MLSKCEVRGSNGTPTPNSGISISLKVEYRIAIFRKFQVINFRNLLLSGLGPLFQILLTTLGMKVTCYHYNSTSKSNLLKLLIYQEQSLISFSFLLLISHLSDDQNQYI